MLAARQTNFSSKAAAIRKKNKLAYAAFEGLAALNLREFHVRRQMNFTIF